MPKMRSGNVGTGDLMMDEYLACGKRHNRPRIHHRICEESCKNKKRCVFYKEWRVLTCEEEVFNTEDRSRVLKKSKKETKAVVKKKKPRKIKIKGIKRNKKIKTQEA